MSREQIRTIGDAVAACRASQLAGWELVAFTQNLAARKFTYSRRNPWDSPERAFERGMGYCQQQALALKAIYDRLGIHAQPVYAMQCCFPPRTIHGIPEPAMTGPHTWLRVTLGNRTLNVCPGNIANVPGKTRFIVLSPVKPLPVWLQPFSHLGSVIENTKRDWQARHSAQKQFERRRQ
jgi:hypothetical protein